MTFNDPRLTRALAAIDGVLAGDDVDTHESEILDFKEDVTMRGPRGEARPGAETDDDAARYYGREASCLANHEGGSLVIGVDDKKTGPAAFLGTSLDGQWLAGRIRELTADPPLRVAVHEEQVAERRLLILLVPHNSGSKPHSIRESKSGARVYPRRTQKSCHNMEFDELVAWRQGRTGYDWSAAPSGLAPKEARAGALEALRDFLRESDEPSRQELAETDDLTLLHRLGLLRDDGNLNAAGALLVCAGPTPRLRYLYRSATSARSNAQVERPGLGLAEELRGVLNAFASNNPSMALHGPGLAQGTVNVIPDLAFREALVNAIMHRDWEQPEPVLVEHVGADVTTSSPGGFFGGVTADTVLTAAPRTRNRQLGDALRSLRLAEREGIGVDRMFIELIRLGHGPPTFTERGEGVRVSFQGGEPLPAVLRAHASMPRSLRDDARMSIAIHLLRKHPSFTADELAVAVQQPASELDAFLRKAQDDGVLHRTANPRPDGSLAWRLADDVRDALGPVLPYYARSGDESVALIAELARRQGTIRNRDVQDLLGLRSNWASSLLGRAAEQGFIELGPGAKARGRGTFYVPVTRGEGSRDEGRG
ncbi:MAG: ATP-binding protein [Solirubrobacteraceae bacterium]